jgi:GT2 family glycosyltransferase
MMKQKNSISVVIPNYNGKALLEKNIPFVYAALKTSAIEEYEIIVSDDHSSDNSVAFIRTSYPAVILIENSTNKGFAGNTNIGISKATKDLVFILNSDVELTEGYFKPLLHYFEQPDTFGVMGRIISLTSDTIQDGAKFAEYSFAKIKTHINYTCPTKDSLYSYFLSGANALVDREKLLKIGGFNEVFNPYNSEDVDLGFMAWRLGYKCYYDHTAVCRHPNSATLKQEPSQKLKHISKRNRYFLHAIHLNRLELTYYLVRLALKTGVRALFLDTNYLKTSFSFFSSFTTCMKSRRRLKALQQQNNQRISLRNVAQFINSEIGTTPISRF